MVLLKTCCQTDIGLVRGNNEDAFESLPEQGFFALADGMGGHKAGEVASSEAVTFMCASIEELFIPLNKNLNIDHLTTSLEEYIKNTNTWIHCLSKKRKAFQGMGTTLSTALFYDSQIIIGHVGDSRIYLFRQGNLIQLTKDHSIGRHTLTQAIGTSHHISPQIEVVPVKPGDIYLMCSDGLPDLLDDEEIQKRINPLDIRSSTDHLIDGAKAAGGYDNITVVLLKVEHLSRQ
ncbi:MAG: serine/threonine-protein phosphatase [Simkaniaceae bacterium]|nr:serine/threonine-protein phosphatase [Simkaniaceae bacterium]